MKEAVANVHIINIDSRASTVHWRFADQTGRQLVLEIIGKETHFYEIIWEFLRIRQDLNGI